MKKSYTTIYYKDQKISGIFAATLENDFYDEVLLGATEIIEESIPKRDIPYFYGISRSPLEFEVTFAFEKPMSVYEIKKYTEMFYANEGYQPLAFEREDGFMTPVYYVITEGEPEVEYIRTDTDKYVGYFKFNFRCNAPYGFEEGRILIENNENNDKTIPVNFSIGSLPTDIYVIELYRTEDPEDPEDTGKVFIEFDGLSSFEYSFKEIAYNYNIITIDSRFKRLEITGKDNPYNSLDMEDFNFGKIENRVVEITLSPYSAAKITYRMPRFI